MKRLAGLAVVLLACHAHAADQLKIGFLSTLSGPAGGIGVEIRDGFNLALKLAGGKLGGMPTEVVIADDTLNPDTGRQLAERMLKRDRVNLMTGIVFSNVMLAVWPSIEQSKVFYIAPNSTPTAISGKGCSPYFFSASWPNEAHHEAAGEFANSKNYKSAFLIAPNYPAGKDALTGFKRMYKGAIVSETYSKLNQLDYSAELAQMRAAHPQAVYAFLPGGMGINFIKQFVGAGLGKSMTLLLPGFSADQDVIRPVGAAMAGIFNTAHWSPDFTNAANQKFMAEFQKEYKRVPTLYASQGYDTARLIDAAVRDVKGKLEDHEAVRKALKAARFESVRGAFRFNTNQYPIQNYYLRTIGSDGKGGLVNKSFSEPIMRDHGDAYAQDCKMKG